MHQNVAAANYAAFLLGICRNLCDTLLMKKSDLQKMVETWAKKIGEREALVRLLERKVSQSTADKLIRGVYLSEPGDLIRSILIEELEKDGFTLAGEAS